jgi:hypothetical protein
MSERHPHAHGVAEHLHVATGMFFNETQRISLEGTLHLVTQFLAVARERGERAFQVAGQHGLHGISIEADQLTEESGGQQMLAAAFLLEDNLAEDSAGNVVAGLGICHDEVFAALHHAREVVQRHIGRRARVIEATVGVLLDDRRFGVRHPGSLAGFAEAS